VFMLPSNCFRRARYVSRLALRVRLTSWAIWYQKGTSICGVFAG
jgi:hypothetical protein